MPEPTEPKTHTHQPVEHESGAHLPAENSGERAEIRSTCGLLAFTLGLPVPRSGMRLTLLDVLVADAHGESSDHGLPGLDRAQHWWPGYNVAGILARWCQQ